MSNIDDLERAISNLDSTVRDAGNVELEDVTDFLSTLRDEFESVETEFNYVSSEMEELHEYKDECEEWGCIFDDLDDARRSLVSVS